MAHCTKCGASLTEGSAFCGSCGAPSGAQAVATTPSTASGAAVAAAPAVAGTGLAMNLAAALSYALGAITGVIFLVLDPYKTDPFVRFHAMQSVLFSVACVIVSIAWSIAAGILVSIAGFWVLTIDVPLRLLFGLAIFILWLYVMFQAYSQREYHIPWIGDFAAKHSH
jgi:uncharacterized membrane protein